MSRRLMLRNASGGGGLPSEYQQVEWISPQPTSGSNLAYIQVLSLGNIPTTELAGYKIVATVSDAPNGWSYSIGGINMIASFSTRTCSYFGVYNSSMALGNNWQIGNNSMEKQTYIYENNGMSATLRCDGYQPVTRARTSVISANAELCIGGRYEGNNGVFRLYSLELFKDTVKRATYIPCFRKSDGIIGVFDSVGNIFHSSVGYWSKGADV